MNSKKLEVLLQKFLDGTATQEENDMLMKWYERVPSDDDTDESGMEEIENKIWAKLEENASHKTSHFSARPQVTRIAASIILLLGLTAALYFGGKQWLIGRDSSALVSLSNTTTVVQFVTLEDGSKISLQPNSELKYPQHFSDSTREVILIGEAFFEIARDVKHPFIVHAKDIKTTVLGTSFNISAYERDKEVSVKVRTGKVAVSHEEKATIIASREILLTPNQQVVYNVETKETLLSLVEKPVIITPVPSLEMKFVRTPVAKIFEALEKAYNVDIQFDAEKVANCRITTDLSDDDDLYERIKVLCHAFGAKYRVENMAFIIDSNGCK